MKGNFTLFFGSDISSNNIHFNITNDPDNNIIIDGQDYKVNITATGYIGLVASASNNTIVKRVGVKAAADVNLAANQGWVGSERFQGTIEYCYSEGVIGNQTLYGCGGIVG